MPLKDGARNDILPFAAESRVEAGEILPQEAWEKDLHRRIGHQPGIARQELANTQARQSSHMGAGVGQFIANRYAPGVVDDGDLDRIEEGLESAVREVVADTIPLPVSIENGGTGNQEGRAVSADKLTAPRTISLSGVITGTAEFNGASDAAITTSGRLATTGTTGIVQLATEAEAKAGTSTTKVLTPATARAILPDTIDHVSTADKLATPRTIALSGGQPARLPGLTARPISPFRSLRWMYPKPTPEHWRSPGAAPARPPLRPPATPWAWATPRACSLPPTAAPATPTAR